MSFYREDKVGVRIFERMADIASTSTTQAAAAPILSAEQELNEFREIVWGSNIRLDVFQRWSQGLILICGMTVTFLLEDSV